ncbi:MAG: helix-turn-helix domain-containing protein [Candidatus Bathyarchaeia archaeon]|jgi:DNA-binding HxlR family transcriptional regulator
MTQENQASKSLEEETFEVLVHQNRRDILRFIGEKKNTTFTEILNAVKISDSPTLAYHLRSLSQFIRQEKGKYQLTPMGKDAYSLLLRTKAYDKIAFLKKRTHRVTFDNAVIWAAVIVAAAYLGVNPVLYTGILPSAAFISLAATYRLVDTTENGCM